MQPRAEIVDPTTRGGTATGSLEELYLTHVALLDEIARFLARRHRLSTADADDLASRIKLKVLENDYEVLRKFQGKSSLRTYLTVVASRLFLDGRAAETGKWRPSAEATRLGETAERLEALLARDGLELGEAVQVLKTSFHATESVDELRALAQRLPARARRRFVGDDAIASLAAPGADAEARVFARDENAAATRARDALRSALEALPSQDRLILRMRYADSFQIAEIASALRLPARPLYKRLDRVLGRLRSRLVESGLDANRVLELIGRPTVDLHAGLDTGEKTPSRPSLGGDEGS